MFGGAATAAAVSLVRTFLEAHQRKATGYCVGLQFAEALFRGVRIQEPIADEFDWALKLLACQKRGVRTQGVDSGQDRLDGPRLS